MRGFGRTTALVALLLIGACGGGRGTPEETLETLRAALASRDGATFLTAVPKETRAHFHDSVRIWKARIDGGDRAPEFLARLPIDADRIRTLEPHAVTVQWMSAANPIAHHQPWIDTAVVAAERTTPSPDEYCLVLRGRDGTEREMWFLREDGRWAFDYLHTKWIQR